MDLGQDPYIEFKIQLARMDERQRTIMEAQRDLMEKIADLLERIESHQLEILKYKNDRNWVIGIFAALWGALLVWVEVKAK